MQNNLLRTTFLNKFPDFPSEMNALGKFVYYRTYSRWLPDKRRRETWKETCARAVGYNASLGKCSCKEAEELFENMFYLRQFLSGRTLWVGGTPVADRFKMSNFNCSGLVIQSWEDFRTMFSLLMLGTGVGFRILRSDIRKVPRIRQNVELVHAPYAPVPKGSRWENTEMWQDKSTAHIIVGDSKGGWTEALYWYFRILSEATYKHITKIIVVYNHVRPKGERLKTFGGTASGHESLKTMFVKIHDVLNTDRFASRPLDGHIRPIHALDIANIIGENVCVGGVRRSSEIALIDPDDIETIEAKFNLSAYPDKGHRHMSNNSVYYEERPTKLQLDRHFEMIKNNGEPGFCNAYAARLRNPNFALPNPCFEALLSNKGMCNLTTTNIMAFVRDGKLNRGALIAAHRLSGRAGLRMTLVTLEMTDWDEVQQRDRLLGVSLTGWYDAMDAIGYTAEQEIELEKELRAAVKDEVNSYAIELGINKPLLVTLVKPEGTLSQVAGGVSAGIHRAHSEYFIRRIRINAHEPLLRTIEAQGWPIKNEVGQGIMVNDQYVPVTTKVVEFPVHSGAKKTKYNVTALDQLKTYFDFQKNYTDANTSITVTVKPDEWESVAEAVWDHWNDFVGVSFLALDTKAYELLPYEAISRSEYERRASNMIPLNSELLNKFELELDTAGDDFDISMDAGCAHGICPVR